MARAISSMILLALVFLSLGSESYAQRRTACVHDRRVSRVLCYDRPTPPRPPRCVDCYRFPPER